MHRGYIKAYRKELESQIWLMPPVYHRTWFVLRQKAKHSPEVFPTRSFGIHLNPGQLITSIDQICQWVGWTEWGKEKRPNKKTITDVLRWLESNGMILVESNATGTFINIVNWGTYNHKEDAKVTESNQHLVTENKRLLDTIKELQELQEKNKKENTGRFSPPEISDVIAYCQERGKGVDPHKWFNFYQAKNWMIGKNKMKDWKAAVHTWEGRTDGNGKNGNGGRAGSGFAEARPAGKTNWLE